MLPAGARHRRRSWLALTLLTAIVVSLVLAGRPPPVGRRRPSCGRAGFGRVSRQGGDLAQDGV